MSRRQRLGLGIVALCLSVPLVVARQLTPDSAGHGTHQQLGLPPCTTIVLFGIRCPSCGMTTSWAHMVRGELFGALRANVAGALLAVLDLLSVAWMLLSAGRGEWTGWNPNSTTAAWIGGCVLVVMLVDWMIRLWLA